MTLVVMHSALVKLYHTALARFRRPGKCDAFPISTRSPGDVWPYGIIKYHSGSRAETRLTVLNREELECSTSQRLAHAVCMLTDLCLVFHCLRGSFDLLCVAQIKSELQRIYCLIRTNRLQLLIQHVNKRCACWDLEAGNVVI